MKDKLFKSTNIEVKSSNEDKREVIAIATQETSDRDGDIVRVDGINIKEYKKNPVILFGHNQYDLPIAKAIRVWKEGKQLLVKMKFPEPEISSMGDTIYKLIKNKYLSQLSIGFKPDWSSAVRIDKTNGWDFKNIELLEISIVPVGSQANARVQVKSFNKAVKDKVIDSLEMSEIELYLKELNYDLTEDEDDKSETDDTVDKSEQTDIKPSDGFVLKNDPFVYIWDSFDTETKDKDEDVYEKIYDLMGL